MSALSRSEKKNRKATHAFLYGMLFALAALLPVNVYAGQEIPELPEISALVAKTDPSLLSKRAALVNERNVLRDRVNRHNAVCNKVEEGSAEEERCLRAFEGIAAAVDSHIKASDKYLEVYQATVKAVADRMSQPNTDGSVVDARNVLSGLPNSLENAIISVYSAAPPGVSERVIKGFQAVMARDWPVAKAWFQDALNRDPDNAGLKRLVSLTDYTPATNKQQTGQRRGKVPAKHTLATLDANADKMSTEEIMKALEEIMEEQFITNGEQR